MTKNPLLDKIPYKKIKKPKHPLLYYSCYHLDVVFCENIISVRFNSFCSFKSHTSKMLFLESLFYRIMTSCDCHYNI